MLESMNCCAQSGIFSSFFLVSSASCRCLFKAKRWFNTCFSASRRRCSSLCKSLIFCCVRACSTNRSVLRLAVYEMLFDMEVPPIVSINEGAEIARDYADQKSANFINGVLNAVVVKKAPNAQAE